MVDHPILGRSNEIKANGNSMEDAMRYNVQMEFHKSEYDKMLYLDMAKRVIFRNCMEKVGVDDETLPNFNKDFYYRKEHLQEALQSCYNARVTAHFGQSRAQKEGLFMDFAQMKREFQGYEHWHPQKKIIEKREKGFDDAYVEDTLAMLRKKSAQVNKFQYQ